MVNVRRGSSSLSITSPAAIVSTALRILLSLCSIDSLVGMLVALVLFSALKQATQSPTTITAPSSTTVGRDDIGYAVSITGCGDDPITEGAAVLAYSIHRASKYGRLNGKYGYQLFAIYHPDAEVCAKPLEKLGYKLLKRDTPVAVSDIQGEFLRSKIESNGCCGEKELIKLEAYTLIDYPVVVHLDLDVLIVRPLDEIFDLMLNRPVDISSSVMWKDREIPKTVNAAYTVDYNMVHPETKYKPVQGGFLVLRPSMETYRKYQNIVKMGDFRQGSGWGGKVGPFYGSMTFQGIIPYYYDVLHPGQSVELNRCIYNQMADNPRTERTVNDVVHGACRSGEETCQDCREAPIDQVVTTHFTLCQKPWSCLPHFENNLQNRLCRQLTHEWFTVRSELEQFWGRSDMGKGSYEKEFFYGYCTKQGKHGYTPIEEPYRVIAGSAPVERAS